MSAPIPTIESKVCSRCQQNKPAVAFGYRNKGPKKVVLESRCRECRRIDRAKSRAVHPRCPTEPKGSIARLRVPGERLVPLIEQWMLEHPHVTRSNTLIRTLNRLRYEQSSFKFDAADRLLIELGLDHEWHGSLADLYERDAA